MDRITRLEPAVSRTIMNLGDLGAQAVREALIRVQKPISTASAILPLLSIIRDDARGASKSTWYAVATAGRPVRSARKRKEGIEEDGHS